MDREGRPTFGMNTPGMFRGAWHSNGEAAVGLFATDEVEP